MTVWYYYKYNKLHKYYNIIVNTIISQTKNKHLFD